jgi:hypothetical protein
MTRRDDVRRHTPTHHGAGAYDGPFPDAHPFRSVTQAPIHTSHSIRTGRFGPPTRTAHISSPGTLKLWLSPSTRGNGPVMTWSATLLASVATIRAPEAMKISEPKNMRAAQEQTPQGWKRTSLPQAPTCPRRAPRTVLLALPHTIHAGQDAGAVTACRAVRWSWRRG